MQVTWSHVRVRVRVRLGVSVSVRVSQHADDLVAR